MMPSIPPIPPRMPDLKWFGDSVVMLYANGEESPVSNLPDVFDDLYAHVIASKTCDPDGFELRGEHVVCPCGWMTPICKVLDP